MCTHLNNFNLLRFDRYLPTFSVCQLYNHAFYLANLSIL
jgi:hypothetical protein